MTSARIIKLHSPGDANLYLISYVVSRAHKSVPQMASWSVQPCLHSTPV